MGKPFFKIKFFIAVGLMLCFIPGTNAQLRPSFTTSLESVISSGAQLPFWFTANQNAIYTSSNSSQQLLTINANQQIKSIFNSPIDVELGTHLITSYSGQFQFQANELFTKFYWWGWKLEAGLFKESGYFNNLSSTNGNIDRSNNARPYPKIRFGTNEFIPFLFWKDWFSFKAEYDEGWLNDNRYVMGTRLHHKSLYGRVKFANQSAFTLGLNHYVMWGGFSPNPTYDQLPDEWQDYWIYITGSVGNERFPVTDQFNVAGNQFGSYHLQYDFNIGTSKLAAFINHPFEDHSGMELKNIRDNLYGIYVDFGEKKIIEAFIYEFMYTKHQGGSVHVQGSTGLDNYYNHGVYLSGYSYEGMMMVSPLFAPVNIVDGIAFGIANNRIIMHHLGWKGTFFPSVTWDGKLTYSQNFGTYSSAFDPVKNQLSALLQFNYHSSGFPLDLSLSLTADHGQLYENRAGILFKISKSF